MSHTNALENKLSSVIDQRQIRIPVIWSAHLQKDKQESTACFPDNPTNAQYNTSIMTSGRDRRLTQHIVEMLDSAKSTAVICSFLLADDSVEEAISDAAERGVRVYLMLACETRLDNDNPDDDFGKMCLDQHKSMLKRLAGKVMIHSASHYHAKLLLVDAIGTDRTEAKGLLLTANLTSEALERNEELAVELAFPEIEEMAEFVKWAFFENAEHQMINDTDFKSIQPLGKVSHPSYSDCILATTHKSNTIRNHALELINEATGQIIISSFGWQKDHQVIEALASKAKEGIDVLVLARIRPSSMPAFIKLKKAGARVFGFKWLHAKSIWNNFNNAMVMSANLQSYGLDTGFEVGVKLDGERANNLKDSLLGFLNNECSELRLDTVLGKLGGPVKVWDMENFRDVVIQEHKSVSLDPVIATCATNLDRKANIPRINWLDCPAHVIEYQWSVVAPTLPKGAKEIFWEETEITDGVKAGNKKSKPKVARRSYSPKVYKIAKGPSVIAITQASEIDTAIKLRDKKFPDANIVMTSGHGG